MAKEDQFQKPVGAEGQEVIKEMNEHHRELTIWGLANIPAKTAKNILDIGCGGGVAIKLLSLKYPNAKCQAIDISEESVNATREYNRYYINMGKVNAQVASVEDLPFPEKTFDIVSAIETYFFWPDLEKNIQHVVSHMADNGILCIISEMYPTPENKEKLDAACKKYHMNIIENDEMKSLLERCGLTVEMYLDTDKNWVTFIGIKK